MRLCTKFLFIFFFSVGRRSEKWGLVLVKPSFRLILKLIFGGSAGASVPLMPPICRTARSKGDMSSTIRAAIPWRFHGDSFIFIYIFSVIHLPGSVNTRRRINDIQSVRNDNVPKINGIWLKRIAPKRRWREVIFLNSVKFIVCASVCGASALCVCPGQSLKLLCNTDNPTASFVLLQSYANAGVTLSERRTPKHKR